MRQACAFVGLLHTDFMHLAGSLLPWAVLAFLLELNYGSIRVVILWLVTLLGGAFTSALLDPPCQVVRACFTPAWLYSYTGSSPSSCNGRSCVNEYTLRVSNMA